MEKNGNKGIPAKERVAKKTKEASKGAKPSKPANYLNDFSHRIDTKRSPADTVL